jgi:hypothetical protein
VPHAAAAAAALARARATGHPVLISADTTADSQTFANPDGSLTNRLSALPARVRRHGQWVPASARLVRAGHGWTPVAATSPVRLSGGGSGPAFVLSGRDGQRLSLWFPGRLSAPVVLGATATYRSVRPGIDLQLTATALGGVTQTLIVRTRAAATSPWLRRLTQRYAATGLKVFTDQAGDLIAARPGAGLGDGPAFTAAPPLVTDLDQAGRHLAAKAATFPGGPAATGRAVVRGDHVISLLGAALTGRQALPVSIAISLTPDDYPAAQLAAARATAAGAASAGRPGAAGPDATFPSPNTIKPTGYDEAQDVQGSGGCQGDKNWNSGSVTQLGIGFQAWDSCIGVYQSYYVFNTSGISNSWIIDHMELNLTEVQASWDACSDANEPVYLHSMGLNAGIGSGSDGSNVSTLGTASGDNKVTVPPASNPASGSNCPNQPADFNVTSYGNSISGSANWTFGVSGDDTDNPDAGQFMRLSDNPTLVTTFDETPPAPSMQQASPSMMDNPATTDTNYGCESSGNTDPEIPWIGATPSVKLNANFTAALTAEDVEPGWDIWDAASTIVNTTQADTGAGSHSYTFNSPVDGDEYYAKISTSVDGNGQSYDPGYKSGSVECSFVADQTPPTVPVVTSSAFPPAGSTTGTTQSAPGASGTFGFSADDPAPSGCSASDPIASAGFGGTESTCLASGVYEFEYSLNQPLASGSATPITTTCPSGGQTSGAVAAVNPTGDPDTDASANPSATTTATSCAIDVSQWGTNILYVAAVDEAGNISQTYQYEFYVPWNSQAKVTPGDINDDGIPDLLTTDAAGDLVFYPGGSDPALGPSMASVADDAPEFSSFGHTWSQFDVTHRGSWTGGSVDDLLALDTSAGNLYRVNNSDTPTAMFENQANLVNIYYPACGTSTDPNNASNCTGYPTAGWSAFSQVVAPGDAWAGAPAGSGITNDTGQPSLLGIDSSTGSLWLFQGSGGQLQNPVQLGASGWNDVTLMAAGTVDGQDTVWARINSGTDAGDVLSFPLAVPSGDAPTLDPASPGTLLTPTSGTILDGSAGSPIVVPQGNYPVVTATGPLSGGTCSATDATACPGFYAQDTSGDLFFYPGQPTTSAALALTGASQLIGNVNSIATTTSLAAASNSINNNLDVFGIGLDGTLEEDAYATGVGWTWTNLGGSVTGTPSALNDTASGNFEVYLTGTNGNLEEEYFSATKQTWGNMRNLGGSITGSPSAVYDPASGNMEVYATGTGGTLEETYWSSANGWSAWKSLGGTITGSPSAVYNPGSGNLEVYATGIDGTLQETYWNSASGWSAWKSLAGSITGSPTAIADNYSNNLEVYATGTNGEMQQITWKKASGWTNWIMFGGSITGRPWAVNDPDRSAMEVYATGTDTTLDEDFWISGDGWSGVNSLGGSLIASPAAAYDPATSNLEVYAISSTGTLNELAWKKSTGSWSSWINLGGSLAG